MKRSPLKGVVGCIAHIPVAEDAEDGKHFQLVLLFLNETWGQAPRSPFPGKATTSLDKIWDPDLTNTKMKIGTANAY